MFTLFIIAVTVGLLVFVNYKFYKARNIIKKQKIEWLILGSSMAAFGIFCYGVRSLFIGMPQVDTFFYRLGITVHLGLGFIPASFFIYRNFLINKTIGKILGWLTVAAALVFTYACIFPPLKRIVKPAPFEPIPMKMSSYPWVSLSWKNVFIWFCISVSVVLIWTVFYYCFKNRKKTKSSSYLILGIGLLLPLTIIIFLMPFLSFQPWYAQWQNKIVYLYILISAALMWLATYYIEDKEEVDSALYYGLAIAYWLFPAMLCIFVTPIFARLLYLPGAIYLYLAYRSERKAIKEALPQATP